MVNRPNAENSNYFEHTISDSCVSAFIKYEVVFAGKRKILGDSLAVEGACNSVVSTPDVCIYV